MDHKKTSPTAFTVLLLTAVLLSMGTGSALADRGYGWVECETAAPSAGTLYISHLFGFEYFINLPPIEPSGDTIADKAWADLVEKSQRGEEFSEKLLASVGEEFISFVASDTGNQCDKSTLQAHGPYDTVEDGKTWQEILNKSWVDFKQEVLGEALKVAQVEYPNWGE